MKLNIYVKALTTSLSEEAKEDYQALNIELHHQA